VWACRRPDSINPTTEEPSVRRVPLDEYERRYKTVALQGVCQSCVQLCTDPH